MIKVVAAALGRWMFPALGAVILSAFLAALLFGERVASSPNPSGSITRDVLAVFHDPGTQWMVCLCLALYFVAFSFLRIHKGVARPSSILLIVILLIIGAVRYVWHYTASMQALVLLAGVVIGQGAGTLKGRRKKVKGRNGDEWGWVIVSIVVGLLVLASVWRADVVRTFEYRNHLRWIRPWDNPNIFGLLMGTGAMLAIGLAVSSFRFSVFSCSEGKEDKTRWWKYRRRFCGFLCLVAVAFMGRGLWHSYSRGAWVATGCGLAYLIMKLEGRRQKAETRIDKAGSGKLKTGMGRMACCCWMLENWFPVAVIFVCALVLVFWRFGPSKRNALADRVVSVVNANDFSWQNRVAAWKGALQIMAERPWLGAGWNRPERLYANYYLPAKLDESAAIQMNDYLMLGATLGIPALMCFLIYLFLSLRSGFSPQRRRDAEEGMVEDDNTNPISPRLCAPAVNSHWLQTACRAGAIVLAVGFWFDGGLFRLPTVSTFWILLELGRNDFRRRDAAAQRTELKASLEPENRDLTAD